MRAVQKLDIKKIHEHIVQVRFVPLKNSVRFLCLANRWQDLGRLFQYLVEYHGFLIRKEL
jgi:hypothetical protein